MRTRPEVLALRLFFFAPRIALESFPYRSGDLGAFRWCFPKLSLCVAGN